MAEALAVALPSGYDDEFVNSVDEDLLCSICHLPLKEAVQTGKCGHRFCRQCLDEHFRRLQLNREPLNCPVDRNILIQDKDIFDDKAIERKILDFIIKCPSDGCQWTGELRSKTDHLTSCPLKIVPCTNKNCSETMTMNNLEKHVTTKCTWRILRCTHCSESHPECKTEAHHAECKKFPLNCSQNCGAVIPREEISAHIEKDCPLTIIPCPYFDHMGCQAKIQRREVESHLQAAMRLHLDLACVKLSDTQKKFEETTKKLENKVNALEKHIHYSEEKCESFTWRIDGFSEVSRKAKSGEENIAHLENCEGLVTECPNNCGIKILKEKVPDHVKDTCPLTEVPCPYDWIGCTWKVQREVLESHLKCETSHHLHLSCCRLNGTQDEVRKLQTKVRKLVERENIRLNEIGERVQALENRFEERVQGLQTHFEERVTVLTDINHKLKGELNTTRMALLFCSAVLIVIIALSLGRLETKLEEQINGVQNKLSRKLGEVEKILELKVTDVRGQLMNDMSKVKKSLETKLDEQINGVQSELKRKVGEVKEILEFKVTGVRGQLMKDMNKVKKSLTVKVQDLEKSIQRGEVEKHSEENCNSFTWKITSYGEALRKAKSGNREGCLESSTFYSCGYKCKLLLYPNGESEGENTHLSFYLVIMIGEYDAMLTWPFHKNVTMTLIDQQEKAKDRENIALSFISTGFSGSFDRPVNDENTGVGYRQFVSHEKLQERRYIVDDTIFIQIRITSPGWR